MFRLVTLNLNGIRSACTKGFQAWAEGVAADCMGVQEIKAQAADVDGKFDVVAGMQGHFHFAERKGYSGVGLYSRHTPTLCKSGIGIIIEEVGAAEPLVKRVLPDFAIPVPMWLVSHREVHTSRRVRMVFDLLVDELRTSRRAGSSAKPPRRAKANAKRKGKKT